MNNVLRHKTSYVKVEIAVFPADTKHAVILAPANAVAGVIEFRRRAIETVEHEERIRNLEERHPVKTNTETRLRRLEGA
jgi:hypothetical protein